VLFETAARPDDLLAFVKVDPNSKITSHGDAAIAAVRQQVGALSARPLEGPSPAILRERTSGALVRGLRNSATSYFRIRVSRTHKGFSSGIPHERIWA